MLYKHEYKILKKILDNPVSSIVQRGYGKQKFVDMMQKGLITKKHHYTDRYGSVLYEYIITKKGFEQLNEYKKYLIDSDPNSLDLDMKAVIDYLLDIKDFESKPGSKYDIYRLLNKKFLTIHEVSKHPLGKTFRFELTTSGEKAYEELLEKM